MNPGDSQLLPLRVPHQSFRRDWFQSARLIPVLVAVVLGTTQSLLAQATIEFKDPVPPANKTRVFAQRCPGELCLENCVFYLSNLTCTVTMVSPTTASGQSAGNFTIKLLDSDGTAIGSTNKNLARGTNDVRPIWTGTKEVTCETKEILKMQVVTTALGEQFKIYDRTNTIEFALHCVGCEKATRTEGNGTTKTEHSTADQSVRLGCVVINLSDDTQPVEVVVSSASGWPVGPVYFPFLLTNGEARELFFEVIVPGGTVDGTTDDITITSAFPGQPDSASAATMLVEIQTPLRLAIPEFDPLGTVLLHVSGPWEISYVVEWSEDLKRWTELTTVHSPPGEEVVTVSDPAPRPGNNRFYRARIAE